jgi:hypothetical protein
MLERKEMRERKREMSMFGVKKSYLTPEYKKKLNEDMLWYKNNNTTESSEAHISELDNHHFYKSLLEQKIKSREKK